jgi:hypothetical protein
MDIYDIGWVQCFMDIINFFRFKKDVKHEFYQRDSKFNKFKLKRNWLGNIIYVQLDFSDEDLMNANYDSETMVMRRLQPIIEYLSRELDWGDYLTPQISNFIDEDENPSLSYGVLFIFTPIRLTLSKFIMNLFVTGGLLGGIVWGLMKLLG